MRKQVHIAEILTVNKLEIFISLIYMSNLFTPNFSSISDLFYAIVK